MLDGRDDRPCTASGGLPCAWTRGSFCLGEATWAVVPQRASASGWALMTVHFRFGRTRREPSTWTTWHPATTGTPTTNNCCCCPSPPCASAWCLEYNALSVLEHGDMGERHLHPATSNSGSLSLLSLCTVVLKVDLMSVRFLHKGICDCPRCFS